LCPTAYAAARPFPHAKLDGLFPESLFEAIDREFPDALDAGPEACNAAQARGWKCFAEKEGGWLKIANSKPKLMGPHLRGVVHAMQSPPFLAFLEALTGISPLIVDPTLFGAGLHQILRNGSLQIHADFNSHRQLRLERRVNVFLFLNHDWDDAWGGELELWNRPMTQCEARIAPVRNRLVVFSSTDYSYHGHADPLACPPHRSRRSIAMYYYTRDRPQWEMVLGNRTNGKPIRHSTLYQRRKCTTCAEARCRAT